MIKEKPLTQRSSGLDREDPREPPHIKEEQEEVRNHQEGEEQPQGLEEANFTGFTLTPDILKTEEEDEKKPETSQLHQNRTEQNREAWRPLPCGCERPSGSKTSHSSEIEDSNDRFKQSWEPQSGSNTLKNNGDPVGDAGCGVAPKPLDSSECGKRSGGNEQLQIHTKGHTGGKTFTCPFCGKKFTKSSNLTTHLRVHTGEKPFTCSVCNTSFSLRCTLVNHMRVHTGEKPFSCSVCGKRFSKRANLTTHMALHAEEKPFKCRVCDKRFTWHSQVRNHKCVFDGGS